jgi:hypothetical protein
MASSKSLGVLSLDLILRLGGFTKGADQAARESAKLSKRMQADAAAISSAFKKIGATLGIGISLTALTTGLVNAAEAAIEYGDEINKASIKSGIAVESFSELAYAAKQNDIELDSLSTALKKMQVTLSEAASGSKSATQALSALGLTAAQLRALSPDEQFETLADRIRALKDPADRARAAVELFGKAGADLLPMFEEGAEGIRQLREEAQQLGATLTGEQAQALAEADDAIKRMEQAWAGVARTLTAQVAPALTTVFDKTTKILSQKGAVLELAEAWAKIAAGPPQTLPMRLGRALFGEEAAAAPVTSTGTGLPPGGRNRTPFVPGFEEAANAAAKATKASNDYMRGLEEIAISVSRITTSATEELYREMDAATQTATEKALAEWTEFDSQINELLRVGRISQDQANERIAENAKQYLEEVQITAQKILPPEVRTELDVFWEEAARNTQNIIADTLISGFDEGVDGMLRSFAQMLAQMAAQAIAADIAGAIFGSGKSGGSSAAGWFDIAKSWFAGFFESGGFIAPGQFGVVGESGPEIVMGGRVGQTVVPMQQAAAAPQVNLRNINAFDSGVIRDYLVSAQGEEVLLNFIERNGTRVRTASVGR